MPQNKSAFRKLTITLPPQWTPGPWRVPPDRIVSEYHEPYGIVSPVPRYGAEDICGTFQERADAVLAAAAPELYDALRALVLHSYDHGCSDTQCLVMVHNGEVALAKARGESPDAT